MVSHEFIFVWTCVYVWLTSRWKKNKSLGGCCWKETPEDILDASEPRSFAVCKGQHWMEEGAPCWPFCMSLLNYFVSLWEKDIYCKKHCGTFPDFRLAQEWMGMSQISVEETVDFQQLPREESWTRSFPSMLVGGNSRLPYKSFPFRTLLAYWNPGNNALLQFPVEMTSACSWAPVPVPNSSSKTAHWDRG